MKYKEYLDFLNYGNSGSESGGGNVTIKGIIPSGTITLSTTGTYNVYNYANATVDLTSSHDFIPIPATGSVYNYTVSSPYNQHTDYIYSPYEYSKIKIYYPGISGTTEITSNINDLSIAGFSTINIKVPTNLGYWTQVPDDIFKNCTDLDYINIPNVTSIGNNAFKGCHKLKFHNNIFPSNVTTIGNNAFQDCWVLNFSNLPDSITQIGEYAFYNSRINIQKLPQNLITLGTACFGMSNYQSSIKIPYFPSGLTEIPSNCFVNSRIDQTSLIINNNIDKIGNYAFYDRRGSLDTIYFQGIPSILGSRIFATSLITNIINIYVPWSEEDVFPGHASDWAQGCVVHYNWTPTN